MPLPVAPRTRDLLALTLAPGLGPILIARLIEALGDPARVLAASLATLKSIRGIGEAKALAIHTGLRQAIAAVDAELALCEKLGVTLLAKGDAAYPQLLAQIPDSPPILYLRGTLLSNPVANPVEGSDAASSAAEAGPAPDQYPLAIVGSRRCTPYGVEQAERFAGALAGAGLTIVSGGARGIDTAAHRAAIRVGGRTVVVLGCGLAHCYPEENQDLFDQVASGHGAVVSELPLNSSPASENFPARNRIISGLSLGVLVIEAGDRSGALITARKAVESHGREVFAVPGRVDSPASRGSLALLKDGGAALVTEPPDILAALESPARHLFGGTHQARYGGAETSGLFPTGCAGQETGSSGPPTISELKLSETQRRLLAALEEPRTIDELTNTFGLDAAAVRADLTVLELRRQVVRRGAKLERTRPASGR